MVKPIYSERRGKESGREIRGCVEVVGRSRKGNEMACVLRHFVLHRQLRGVPVLMSTKSDEKESVLLVREQLDRAGLI